MDDILRALAIHAGDIPRLARRWVEENSFTENVAGVNRVGALLKEAFALPSLTLEVWPSDRFGEHLVWRTKAASERAPVLLIGHHDTVFPPGHFAGWREADGHAIGPGVLDMKGGLAVICVALAALEEAGALAAMPIVVISVADEELGSPDSGKRLQMLARGAACALVFESGRQGDPIVTRRRGTGVVTCHSEGRAAHAGSAHADGVNAIWALARFIDAAQRLTDYARGVTVNVGRIVGGTSKNTVPAEASCEVDIRYESVADAEALVRSLDAAAGDAAASVPGAHLSLTGGPRRMPLVPTPATATLFGEYAACQRAAGLGASESPIVGGGSDANTVAAVGVPAIDGLGPRGDGFHTTHEYVELASFAPKAEALVRFLCGRFAATMR